MNTERLDESASGAAVRDVTSALLRDAISSRQIESVKALLREGVDINAKQDDGRSMTPLNVASSLGFTDIPVTSRQRRRH